MQREKEVFRIVSTNGIPNMNPAFMKRPFRRKKHPLAQWSWSVESHFYMTGFQTCLHTFRTSKLELWLTKNLLLPENEKSTSE